MINSHAFLLLPGCCCSDQKGRTPFRNQEMECRCDVVLGYLRRYGTYIMMQMEATTLTRISFELVVPTFSAPFAATPSTNRPLNTRPTPLRRMTVVFRLRLGTVDMYSTWTVFNVGSRRGVFVRCAIRNGIMQRLNAFRVMDRWVFRKAGEVWKVNSRRMEGTLVIIQKRDYE